MSDAVGTLEQQWPVEVFVEFASLNGEVARLSSCLKRGSGGEAKRKAVVSLLRTAAEHLDAIRPGGTDDVATVGERVDGAERLYGRVPFQCERKSEIVPLLNTLNAIAEGGA